MLKAAIYSRKSIFTGKGDSIENQVELCKNYLERFYPEITEFIIYEDEGFSGGNTNRPKFQQLLKDIKTGEISVLICYRLDRISRSVADFSTTYNLLEENNVSFISVKEQFDTSTPLGKAMLYISSVFAQLERETIAERVRDNMIQLSKTGRWLGGQEPYGFKAEKISYIDENFNERSLMKLSPIKEELSIVKLIYDKYLETNSITQVTNFLQDNLYKGKNGGEWATTQVQRILSSTLYVASNEQTHKYLKSLGINVYGEPNGNGYLSYNKTKKLTIDRDISEWIVSISNHKGLIDPTTWLRVQRILEKNKDKKIKRLGTGNKNTSLLSGLLKCSECGSNMIIKQGHKSKKEENKRYDYYVCSNKDNSRGKKCSAKNIRVDRLDKIVIEKLSLYNKDVLNNYLKNMLNATDKDNDNSLKKKTDSLKKEISELETSINNLLKQLSASPSQQVADYIMQEINRLSNEINTKKESLEQVITNKKTFDFDIENLKLIINLLDNFDKNFELTSDISQKRLLLQTILNEVIWDGKNFEAKLIIFKDKKNCR